MSYYRKQIPCIHCQTLKMESNEPSCGIIPKTYTLAENGVVQWVPLTFKSQGITFLYNRGSKFFHVLAGEA